MNCKVKQTIARKHKGTKFNKSMACGPPLFARVQTLQQFTARQGETVVFKTNIPKKIIIIIIIIKVLICGCGLSSTIKVISVKTKMYGLQGVTSLLEEYKWEISEHTLILRTYVPVTLIFSLN